jgi:lauroyl/myristoyl acyltransferase
MTTGATAPRAITPLAPRRRPVPAALRAGAARFWQEALMRTAHRAPILLRVVRPIMLSGAWRCSAFLRDGTMANAARILGPSSGPREREALAKRVVASCYDFVCDIGRHRGRTAEELRGLAESVRGEQHYRDARDLGRGAIIVTAHLGSFELGTAMLRAHEERIHVVFHRDRLSSFERLRSEQRARLGVIEAPVDDGWGVWLRLREALLANEVVMLQGDRVMPGQAGERVPFLGGHIEMPAGPVKLAMATGAPIIPVFTIRSGLNRFQVVIEEPILVEPGPIRRDGPHPALLRLAGAIERQVARYPDQWLMLHRVWCEDRQPIR